MGTTHRKNNKNGDTDEDYLDVSMSDGYTNLGGLGCVGDEGKAVLGHRSRKRRECQIKSRWKTGQ